MAIQDFASRWNRRGVRDGPVREQSHGRSLFNLASSSLPAGYWAKEQQAPHFDHKSILLCSLGNCSWWDTGRLRKSKGKHQVWQFLYLTHDLARNIYIYAEDLHQKKAHSENLNLT
jgi:hypothetical protein